MHYFASHIDEKLYSNLKKKYEIDLLESEMDTIELKDQILRNPNDFAIIFQHPDQSMLNSLAFTPCNKFLELEDDEASNENLIGYLNNNNSFYLSLKAMTVHKISLAHILAKNINRRMNLPEIIQNRIVTAMHEALIEVVISGCLEINLDFNNLATYETYYDLLEKRLAMPEYQNRRVVIQIGWDAEKITFSLEYEGKNCTLKQVISNSDLMISPSAQRIDIIKKFTSSIELSPNENKVNLIFDRKL